MQAAKNAFKACVLGTIAVPALWQALNETGLEVGQEGFIVSLSSEAQ